MKKKVYVPFRVEVLEMDIKNAFMMTSMHVSEDEVEGGLVKGESWFEDEDDGHTIIE